MDQVLGPLKEALREIASGICQPELKNNYWVTLASLLIGIFFGVYICSLVRVYVGKTSRCTKTKVYSEVYVLKTGRNSSACDKSLIHLYKEA